MRHFSATRSQATRTGHAGWAIALLLTFACSGCSNLRLPAIDPSGQTLFSPLPTTTSLALPQCLGADGCLSGPCNCLGCVRGLGSCLRCPGFDYPEPAFVEPVDPPPCTTPAPVGIGVPTGEPCVPAPDCGPECRNGPPAVLYGKEISAKKKCQLPPRGKRGCILLSPQKIVAPVGGEVMLLSGICGDEGRLQVGEPLEWMLSRDSVGNIIAVGDDAPGVLHHLVGIDSSKKEDPGFARGVTSTKEMLITRGNMDPSDDVMLEKGQTWLTLSSASEGTSHLTVLAPDSECWDQRKASATIYWVDARWQFPAPQRVPAGQPVDLITRVTRAEGSLPARGWKVRYEILQPELASFAGTDGSSVVEVNVDESGNAPATLVPVPGTSGNAVVDIQVIRPGGLSDNMPDLTLGRGQAYVTWSSPQLTMRTGGPDVAPYGEPFEVYANVANPGDQDATGVQVEVAIPDGVRVLGSDAFAKVFPNAVVWDIGAIPPQQQLDLSLQLTSTNPLALSFQARGDGGLIAESVVRVDVFRPALAIRVEAEQDRVQAGDPVRFRIDVENTGDRPLRDVFLDAVGDSGMVHTETGSDQIRTDKTDGPLQPGETWSSTVTFVPTDSGRRCVTVTANAAGAQRASGSACVTAINPPPPTPALTTALQSAIPGGGNQAVVGQEVVFRGRVENTGRVPLTDVRATMSFDPSLVPDQATEDYPRDTNTPYLIAWTIPQLTPGQTVVLETYFIAQSPAARSQVIFAAESAEGARGSQAGEIIIQPSASAPSGPLTAPPVLPPSQQPPTIPGGPGTPPPSAQPPRPTAPPPAAPRRGSLRLNILQRDIAPRVGDPIRYAVSIVNDSDYLDSGVQIAMQMPPGVTIERLTQTTSPDLGNLSRSGNTVYFEEIRTLKPGETIDYELVLRSNQPQTFQLQFEATSRNSPSGIAATQRTEVSP